VGIRPRRIPDCLVSHIVDAKYVTMKVGLIIPWTLVQHCSGYSQTKECSSLITLRGDSFRLSCRHGDGNAQAASAATGILEEARRRGLNIHGQYVLTERERREAEESIKTILANDSDAEHPPLAEIVEEKAARSGR